MIPALFTQYQLVFIGLGIALYILISTMSLIAAWMFQGETKRTLTGPLYSTVIAIVISGLMVVVSCSLLVQDTVFLWALGISLFVFSLMISFTAGLLSLVSMSRSKFGHKGILQRAMEKKLNGA